MQNMFYSFRLAFGGTFQVWVPRLPSSLSISNPTPGSETTPRPTGSLFSFDGRCWPPDFRKELDIRVIPDGERDLSNQNPGVDYPDRDGTARRNGKSE